jgi:hypothetical protein
LISSVVIGSVVTHQQGSDDSTAHANFVVQEGQVVFGSSGIGSYTLDV